VLLGSSSPAAITLYTSVTQATADATVAAFKKARPATAVTVFRAATGALNARIAADQRSGGLRADVLWVSDPLTMHGYDTQGLLAKYDPPSASALPAADRTATFNAAGLLFVVAIYHKGTTPVPASWSDLGNPAYKNGVVIPNPGFAGSALGALGYYGRNPAFGLDFYRGLKAAGATQVQSPDDVVTAVAQGRAKVGMTLADSALAAAKMGSPIVVVWPQPGAIAIYSPIGLTTTSKHLAAAQSFVDFTLSAPGQEAIASMGRQPARPGVAGGPLPPNAPVVTPDWSAVFGDAGSLLKSYQGIFGQ
jgi:iron(III) transport system substrate-binding protein